MKNIFYLILLTILTTNHSFSKEINCETAIQKLNPKCNLVGKGLDKMKEFSKKNKTLDQSYKNIKEKFKKK